MSANAIFLPTCTCSQNIAHQLAKQQRVDVPPKALYQPPSLDLQTNFSDKSIPSEDLLKARCLPFDEATASPEVKERYHIHKQLCVAATNNFRAALLKSIHRNTPTSDSEILSLRLDLLDTTPDTQLPSPFTRLPKVEKRSLHYFDNGTLLPNDQPPRLVSSFAQDDLILDEKPFDRWRYLPSPDSASSIRQLLTYRGIQVAENTFQWKPLQSNIEPSSPPHDPWTPPTSIDLASQWFNNALGCSLEDLYLITSKSWAPSRAEQDWIIRDAAEHKVVLWEHFAAIFGASRAEVTSTQVSGFLRDCGIGANEAKQLAARIFQIYPVQTSLPAYLIPRVIKYCSDVFTAIRAAGFSPRQERLTSNLIQWRAQYDRQDLDEILRWVPGRLLFGNTVDRWIDERLDFAHDREEVISRREILGKVRCLVFTMAKYNSGHGWTASSATFEQVVLGLNDDECSKRKMLVGSYPPSSYDDLPVYDGSFAFAPTWGCRLSDRCLAELCDNRHPLIEHALLCLRYPADLSNSANHIHASRRSVGTAARSPSTSGKVLTALGRVFCGEIEWDNDWSAINQPPWIYEGAAKDGFVEIVDSMYRGSGSRSITFDFSKGFEGRTLPMGVRLVHGKLVHSETQEAFPDAQAVVERHKECLAIQKAEIDRRHAAKQFNEFSREGVDHLLATNPEKFLKWLAAVYKDSKLKPRVSKIKYYLSNRSDWEKIWKKEFDMGDTRNTVVEAPFPFHQLTFHRHGAIQSFNPVYQAVPCPWSTRKSASSATDKKNKGSAQAAPELPSVLPDVTDGDDDDEDEEYDDSPLAERNSSFGSATTTFPRPSGLFTGLDFGNQSLFSPGHSAPQMGSRPSSVAGSPSGLKRFAQPRPSFTGAVPRSNSAAARSRASSVAGVGHSPRQQISPSARPPAPEVTDMSPPQMRLPSSALRNSFTPGLSQFSTPSRKPDATVSLSGTPNSSTEQSAQSSEDVSSILKKRARFAGVQPGNLYPLGDLSPQDAFRLKDHFPKLPGLDKETFAAVLRESQVPLTTSCTKKAGLDSISAFQNSVLADSNAGNQEILRQQFLLDVAHHELENVQIQNSLLFVALSRLMSNCNEYLFAAKAIAHMKNPKGSPTVFMSLIDWLAARVFEHSQFHPGGLDTKTIIDMVPSDPGVDLWQQRLGEFRPDIKQDPSPFLDQFQWQPPSFSSNIPHVPTYGIALEDVPHLRNLPLFREMGKLEAFQKDDLLFATFALSVLRAIEHVVGQNKQLSITSFRYAINRLCAAPILNWILVGWALSENIVSSEITNLCPPADARILQFWITYCSMLCRNGPPGLFVTSEPRIIMASGMQLHDRFLMYDEGQALKWYFCRDNLSTEAVEALGHMLPAPWPALPVAEVTEDGRTTRGPKSDTSFSASTAAELVYQDNEPLNYYIQLRQSFEEDAADELEADEQRDYDNIINHILIHPENTDRATQDNRPVDYWSAREKIGEYDGLPKSMMRRIKVRKRMAEEQLANPNKMQKVER